MMSGIRSLQLTCVGVLLIVVRISSAPGTTPHLKDIFIGRCWDYTEIRYRQQSASLNVNCTNLWNVFYKAFSYRAPCDLSMSRYEEFIDSATQVLPTDKVMFWSGTYDIAHEYAESGKRFLTLEDTLIGYLVNSLVWCGSASDGANMTRCPSWTDCPLEASESFWASASKQFAYNAKGDVYLMVSGSRGDKPAYSPDSFFGKYELPNLVDVNKVIIIVTHSLTGESKETCSTGSLLVLQEAIRKRGLLFDCVDDPEAVVHLLCADDPEARECKMINFPAQAKNIFDLSFNSRPDRFHY